MLFGQYVAVTMHIFNSWNKTTTEIYIVSEEYTKFSLGELGNLSGEMMIQLRPEKGEGVTLRMCYTLIIQE